MRLVCRLEPMSNFTEIALVAALSAPEVSSV
jgi:hypothetical protein